MTQVAELEDKANKICQYKSGHVLLICTVIIKKMELRDLQRLTDRCMAEERERFLSSNAELSGGLGKASNEEEP